ncbi:MAG: TIGR01459 family HAD-type hydrolase [Alphaproteobacteria bacterium]
MSDSQSPDPHPIRLIHGISKLAPNYDGFVLDLWGVIHNGVEAFSWALDALRCLQGQGARVVLLSNAPRRPRELVAALEKMGVPRELYDEVISSGREAYAALCDRTLPFYRNLGRHCFHLGPPRDRNMLEIDRLIEVRQPEKAEFVLATGPVSDDKDVAFHEDLLRGWAKRDVPMICANPDLVVIRGDERLICAGAIAQRYEELGGRVQYHGKPFPEIYDTCRDVLGIRDSRRILAIGDSLRTDIRGAQNAGMDSILVAGGIHGDEWGLKPGAALDPENPPEGLRVKISEACQSAGLRPLAVMGRFAWDAETS